MERERELRAGNKKGRGEDLTGVPVGTCFLRVNKNRRNVGVYNFFNISKSYAFKSY